MPVDTHLPEVVAEGFKARQAVGLLGDRYTPVTLCTHTPLSTTFWLLAW